MQAHTEWVSMQLIEFMLVNEMHYDFVVTAAFIFAYKPGICKCGALSLQHADWKKKMQRGPPQPCHTQYSHGNAITLYVMTDKGSTEWKTNYHHIAAHKPTSIHFSKSTTSPNYMVLTYVRRLNHWWHTWLTSHLARILASAWLQLKFDAGVGSLYSIF